MGAFWMHRNVMAALAIVVAITCSFSIAEEKQGKGPPTVKDEDSGIVVVLKDDNRTLVAKDSEAKVIWEVDVIKTAGEPGVGAPVVRHLSLQDQAVTATYGKHSFAVFDLKSGKLLSRGSD